MQHPLYLGCCQKVRQSLRGGGRQACTFCRSRSRINPHFLGNRALQTVMFLLGQFSQVCLLATERLHRVGRGIPSVSASSQLGARAVFVSISVLRIPKCFLLLFRNMKHYGQWWLPPVCSQRREGSPCPCSFVPTASPNLHSSAFCLVWGLGGVPPLLA